MVPAVWLSMESMKSMHLDQPAGEGSSESRSESRSGSESSSESEDGESDPRWAVLTAAQDAAHNTVVTKHSVSPPAAIIKSDHDVEGMREDAAAGGVINHAKGTVRAKPPQAPSTGAFLSGASNSATGILTGPNFACAAANIEVTMLDGSVMGMDEHQQRINISLLIKQSKLTKTAKLVS